MCEETNYQLGGGSAEVTQGHHLQHGANGTNVLAAPLFAGATTAWASRNVAGAAAQLLAAFPAALQANPDTCRPDIDTSRHRRPSSRRTHRARQAMVPGRRTLAGVER